LNKKVSKGIAGVNLIAAIETGLTVSERVRLEQNDVRKAARRKQQPSQKSLLSVLTSATPSQRPVLPSRPGATMPSTSMVRTEFFPGSNENTNKHRPGARHGRITSKCNIHSMGGQLHNQQLSTAILYRRRHILLTSHFYTQQFGFQSERFVITTNRQCKLYISATMYCKSTSSATSEWCTMALGNVALSLHALCSTQRCQKVLWLWGRFCAEIQNLAK